MKVTSKTSEVINTNSLLIYYLLGINAMTFALYGIDKLRSKKGWWRIPEKTLLMLAAIGGSMGALCGIRLFHHKTKHKKFYLGVSILLVLQIALICYFGFI